MLPFPDFIPEDTCVVGTNVCMDLIRVEVRVKLAV